MTKPTDLQVSEALHEVFKTLLDELEERTGERPAASLVIFTATPGGKINYISNCDRGDVVKAWTQMLKGWEDGMPDIPAHEIN